MEYQEIQEVYKSIFESYSKPSLETHIQKIIELDQFLPYSSTFFCITNTQDLKFEYISKNFKACLGLDSVELKAKGMKYFWSRIHPEDIEVWLAALNQLMEFTIDEISEKDRTTANYTWNYRFKNAKGEYVNIIQNTTPLQFDDAKKPIIGMAHYTVLDGDMHMDICASAKNLNDNNEYETLFYEIVYSQKLLDVFTNRERDIIRLIITKNKTEVIADKLNISIHTVNTHRKNILKKINIDSTFELISYFKNNPKLI